MPSWLARVLIPFSWLYGLVVFLRKRLYKSGIYTRSQFDFPIICVGNITAGGTGKTPHIEWLIRQLSARHRVAVLSRGYKRKTSGYLLATAQSTPAEIGDEPFQVKQKFPEIAVAVSENRVLGIPALLGDEPDVNVVLMDDGFQHLSIRAGFNIVLCDYNRPYYADRLLPAGLLREGAEGASRADVVIVTKCPPDLGAEAQQEIITRLRLHAHQQVFFSTVVYGEWVPLTQAAQESAFLPHHGAPPAFHRAVALAGIAKAQPFIDEVSRHFDEVVPMVLSDHTGYDAEKINQLKKKAAQPGTVVITTEKDAVKLMDKDLVPQISQLPVWYLPVSVHILNHEGEKLVELLETYIAEEQARASGT